MKKKIEVLIKKVVEIDVHDSLLTEESINDFGILVFVPDIEVDDVFFEIVEEMSRKNSLKKDISYGKFHNMKFYSKELSSDIELYDLTSSV